MVVRQMWDGAFPVVVATRHASVDEDYCGSCVWMMLAIWWHDDIAVVVRRRRHIGQAEMYQYTSHENYQRRPQRVVYSTDVQRPAGISYLKAEALRGSGAIMAIDCFRYPEFWNLKDDNCHVHWVQLDHFEDFKTIIAITSHPQYTET